MPQATMTERVNILMVDDQPGKLLSYEAILGELGENLIKATSGREALEHLLKTDVAVVLMDVSMPEIDGFELAEIIRQHPRYQKTAIIFISAVHLTDLDRLKGYQRGAVDYISVPVVPELLRAKVSVFAELYRKTQQLRRLNRELEQRVLDRTEELERRNAILENVNNQLGRKNQELDAIITTAPDIIFSTKADGKSEYVSERFYEYTGAEISLGSLDYFSYVHPEDVKWCLEEWKRCVESGKLYEAEYRLRSGGDVYRWFRMRAVPLRDDEGNISRWYGTCSDIHDSKLLEQSMRENAIELERMVDDRTAELRRLSTRLMKLQDEERRRIARDIHDGLGQELIAAKMILDGMLKKKLAAPEKQNLSDAIQLVDRTIQQVRSISHLLHPPLLDEVGLLSALRWYLDGLTNRSGIKTHLEVQPDDLPRLANELETTVFRIIQEALSNVFRHAKAHNVWVTVTLQEGNLMVAIQDDGIGLAEKIVEFRPGSFGVGIGGMRQRALDIGGELRIRNANPGASVEIVIPTNLPCEPKMLV